MMIALLSYSILVGAICTLSATLFDFGLRSRRFATRYVWVSAALFCLGLTLVAVVGPRTPSHAPAISTTHLGSQEIQVVAPTRSLVVWKGPAFQTLIATGRSADKSLRLVWAAASVIWGIIVFRNLLRMRAQLAEYECRTIDGVRAYVSARTGPTVFGVLSYKIILPEWTLRLPSSDRQLILRHEREHQSKSDPALLLTMAAVLFVLPLNPFIWVMFRRLHSAVELDCDQRVLAWSPSAMRYGSLMIRVAERAMNEGRLQTAFVSRRSLLETRLRHITSPASRPPAWRSFVLIGAALILTASACGSPVPNLRVFQDTSRPATVQISESAGSSRIVRIDTSLTNRVNRDEKNAPLDVPGFLRAESLSAIARAAEPELFSQIRGRPAAIGLLMSADGKLLEHHSVLLSEPAPADLTNTLPALFPHRGSDLTFSSWSFIDVRSAGSDRSVTVVAAVLSEVPSKRKHQ